MLLYLFRAGEINEYIYYFSNKVFKGSGTEMVNNETKKNLVYLENSFSSTKIKTFT